MWDFLKIKLMKFKEGKHYQNPTLLFNNDFMTWIPTWEYTIIQKSQVILVRSY